MTSNRPPAPEAPGKKLAYVAIPAAGWRIPEDGTLCRHRDRRGGRDNRCPETATVEKETPADQIYPWRGYCKDHAARQGHWAEDGTVMTWDLRRKDHEDVPLTAAEAARLTGGGLRMCSEHRRPRSECPPSTRHNHSVRFRDDLWDGIGNAAHDIATWLTQAAEIRSGYLRCDKCDQRSDDAPPVPVEFGDLTGRTLDEWIGVALAQVRAQHPRHEPVLIGAEPLTPVHAVPFKAPAVTR